MPLEISAKLPPVPDDLVAQVNSGRKWVRLHGKWWLVRGPGAVRYLLRQGIKRHHIIRLEQRLAKLAPPR